MNPSEQLRSSSRTGNQFIVYSRDVAFSSGEFEGYVELFESVYGKGPAGLDMSTSTGDIKCRDGMECDISAVKRALLQIRNKALHLLRKKYAKLCKDSTCFKESRYTLNLPTTTNGHFHFDTYPEPCNQRKRRVRAFVNLASDYCIWVSAKI